VQAGLSSGFPELDQQLAGNGWPNDGVTELLLDEAGIGELRLLLPALSYLSNNLSRWITFVAPPYIPYAPALVSGGVDLTKVLIISPENQQDALWATEKALSSQSCSAVLAWPDKHLKQTDIRRLQVAAKSGHCWNILFRSSHIAHHPSPAELRILLRPCQGEVLSDSSFLNASIIKRRGGWATGIFPINLQDKLNRITPDFSELMSPYPAGKNRTIDKQSLSSFRSSRQVSHHIDYARHEDIQLQ